MTTGRCIVNRIALLLISSINIYCDFCPRFFLCDWFIDCSCWSPFWHFCCLTFFLCSFSIQFLSRLSMGCWWEANKWWGICLVMSPVQIAIKQIPLHQGALLVNCRFREDFTKISFDFMYNYFEFNTFYFSIASPVFFCLNLPWLFPFLLSPAWYSSLSYWKNENEVLSVLICFLLERNVAKTVQLP